MSFGTLLTLFVVPVAYTLLARKAHIEAHGIDAVHARSRARATPGARATRD